MDETLSLIINIALLAMIALLPLAFYRVAKIGQEAADRLVGVDMITNLLVAIAVMLAITEGTDASIDIGIALAALSFAGTASIARYISEGRVF